jgi:uncharacterized protein (TIGR03435 family)
VNSHAGDLGGELKAEKTKMDDVAECLSREMGRPVLDETGLTASYDFTLRFSKERADGLTDNPTHPIVSRAIQEQLGLRLEKRTAPVPVVVIDHVESVPLEN